MIKNLVWKIKRNGKEGIAYLFWGVVTSIINIVSFHFLFNNMGLGSTVSNTIAWLLAVTVAFFTNRKWVFVNKDAPAKGNVLYEALKFYGCRIATLLLEDGLLFVGIDLLEINSDIVKIFATGVVIVANYVFSKLVVFRNAKSNTN